VKVAVLLSLFCLPIFVAAQTDALFLADPCDDTDIVMAMEEGGAAEVLPGCSWYCGGTVHGFASNSFLSPYKAVTYGPENAHDFNLNTAWVEGEEDHGVGASLTYTFDFSDQPPHQLGITHLLIANGYRKSERLWNLNSRVARLRMYVDEKHHGDVLLEDCLEFQRVEIDTIRLPNDRPMTIRFKILDVYQGDKYADTAITELLFEGIGVH
jgi:hypothetical protein